MKSSKRSGRVQVSADGSGVVSHAGVELLREMAVSTGLVEQVNAALADTYTDAPVHAPGRVFADLAAAIADGADAVSQIATLVDRPELFGPVASTPTAWRLLGRIDEQRLPAVRAARAAARERAWAAGAGPDVAAGLVVDIDAEITLAYSEKQQAAKTWKKTFGFHPLLAFLDRPDIAGGEALAGMLRPGNAGSNTAADHIEVLDLALAGLPAQARPRPGDPAGPRLLVRTDSAGASRAFAAACRDRGVGFSVGFDISPTLQQLITSEHIPADRWTPALDADNQPRAGAWVAEVTDCYDLSAWPQHSRLILRAERAHPGAQLRFTDPDGLRVTALLTDTDPAPGDTAALELRHRRRARVEDRIREAKATGLRNLPSWSFAINAAWLEAVLAATDLVAWTQAVCFADTPSLARCEIHTFRYRVLHTAARLARTGRQLRLRLDRTWRWAAAIAAGFGRLRAAFC